MLKAASLLLFVLYGATAQAQRLVLIDQDGSGPAGSNQMAMIALLQAPDVRVLGITMVSGNAWEPEEVAHTLRMLELLHRTEVPVVGGAIFPLLHTRGEAMADRAREGSLSWYGAWGSLADHTSNEPYHAPEVIPPLREGVPMAAPLNEDAAHFILRQVHAHPHQVTIYAAGPLTNLALALALDPHVAELAQSLVLMGGSLSPATDDPEFALHPRHEFNFWFDPEAAHLVLRAAWPRIDLTTADISLKTHFTPALLKRITVSQKPSAQYLAKYTGDEFYYMWDELAACAWIDPRIITKEQLLYVDVDLTHGPSYGDTLTWDAAHKPPRTDLRLVHVQQELDTERFYNLFVQLMEDNKAPQQSLLEVNGLHFQATSLGPTDGELVLLLHGFPQFADAWLGLQQVLAEAGYRAVAIDQRGYSPGARPAEVSQYALPLLVADVFGFAQALGADSFHLVGHDWGAIVGWAVAAQQPARLRSLTALAVPHVDAFMQALHGDLDQMWRSKYVALFKAPGHVAEALLLGDQAHRLRGVYQGKVPAAQVEANVRRLSEAGALTATLDWYRALELSTRIGPVQVPSLYVWGDQDIALGETAALATERHVEAPYRFERLKGISHWMLEEAPDTIAALVLEHLQQQRGASTSLRDA